MISSYEEMGFDSFFKGVKYAENDPAFTMAILAEVEACYDTPEDDWNQGWLKAYYEVKNKEREYGNKTTDNATKDS